MFPALARLRCALPLAFFVLLFALASDAAQAQEMTLAPSAALSCIARKDGKDDKLQYPQEALERKDGGTIKVDMTFSAPDHAPRVKLDSHAQSEMLDDAVEDYVKGFRLPCMPPSAEPITLHQTYIFTPNDGRKVVATNTEDAADLERAKQMGCIRNVADKDKPVYPMDARRDEAQGKYYLEMTFSSPDKAPELRWLVTGKYSSLRRSVEDYARDLRMPCQHGDPVHARILFDFKITDGERTVLRDMSLRQFVGGAKNLQSAYFDLNTMGCPFDLRVRYLQPHERNAVAQLETANPARQAFVDWISNIELNFTDAQLSKIMGDSFTLSVPCGSVNL